MINKYRKRPLEIEAIQWLGNNSSEIFEFANEFIPFVDGDDIFIDTLDGRMKMSKGDYIIKGIRGEFYPCKQDIFEELYEIVQ